MDTRCNVVHQDPLLLLKLCFLIFHHTSFGARKGCEYFVGTFLQITKMNKPVQMTSYVYLSRQNPPTNNHNKSLHESIQCVGQRRNGLNCVWRQILKIQKRRRPALNLHSTPLITVHHTGTVRLVKEKGTKGLVKDGIMEFILLWQLFIAPSAQRTDNLL